MYSRKSVGPGLEGTRITKWIFQWFIFLGVFLPATFVKAIIGNKWLDIAVKNRSWLPHSSKGTNWYNHLCYDNVTLTTFERSEKSRSKSISSAQSKNVAWTRKFVSEIASIVHNLVLFFLLHNASFFLNLNSFSCYLISYGGLVSVEWISSESLKIGVTGVETDW